MREFMKYATGLLLAALLLAGAGCSKHVGFDTTFILKAWNQAVSGGDLEPLSDLMLYGYAADTTQWTVASYEDALAYRLTDKSTGETVENPEVVGTPYELEGFGSTLAMQTERSSLLVVVVDRTNRLYGYIQQAFSENMPQMYVSLVFQPWKKNSSFKNGNWWMFNDFYIPDVTCTLKPSVQLEENGETEVLKKVTLYAFTVSDPALWEAGSYENAAIGQLTNTITGEKVVSATKASGDSAGTVTLGIQPGSYLLLAVDTQNRSYALRTYTAEEAEELTILFAPWRTDSPYADGEWKIWNDPEETEEPDPDEGDEGDENGDESGDNGDGGEDNGEDGSGDGSGDGGAGDSNPATNGRTAGRMTKSGTGR